MDNGQVLANISLISLGSCLAGGILFPLGLCYMKIREQIEGWQSVKATVTDVRTERRYHNGRPRALYIVSYTYEVAGKVFSKVLQGYAGQRYSKGNVLDLWVNPTNPNGHLVMAEAGSLDSGPRFLILGILLLAGGMLMTLNSPQPGVNISGMLGLVTGLLDFATRSLKLSKMMQDS